MTGGKDRLELPQECRHPEVRTQYTNTYGRTLSHSVIPRTPLNTTPEEWTDFEERFWEFVEIPETDPENKCWEWQAERRNGYGRVLVTHDTNDYRRHTAHRAVYEISIGPIPEHAEVLHHECDNNSCCNPAHLRPTTISENNRIEQEGGGLNIPTNPAPGTKSDVRLLNMVSTVGHSNPNHTESDGVDGVGNTSDHGESR